MTLFPKLETRILLPVPNGELELKAASADSAAKITVVICHPHPQFGGTMENKVVTTLFRTFKNLGANVVRFNYRGVGASSGVYGHAIGEIEDLQHVVNWLAKVQPEQTLWLAGFSFGSYIAASSAKPLNAKQLITIAPAVEHFDFNAIAYPTCPWLVIQGETDEIVPPTLVYQWIEQQTQPPKLIRLPEAGHFFHGKLTDLKHILETEFQADFLC